MKKKVLMYSCLFALSLCALPLASCGTSPSSSSVAGESSSSSTEDIKASIKTPSKTTLEVEETIVLEAEVTGASSDATINWFSSDETIASVTQKGKVIALKEGTTNITIKVGEVTSEPVTITVVPKKNPTITLATPEKESIEVNETLQLSFTTKDIEETGITFVTSNENASVSKTGLVKGLKEGTVDIYCQIGEVKSNSVTITIIPETKELTVSLEPVSNKYLLVNGTYTLTPVVKGNINNYPLEYVSSNAEVLSVSETGVVTALKEGTATVTLKVHNVTSQAVEFVVLENYSKVESVSYSKDTIDLVIGNSFTFEGVTILPESAEQTFTLTSSDSKIVSVDGNTITALKASSDPITITITAGEATFSVKVNLVSAFDAHIPEIKTKLEKANEKEATLAKKGHFYLHDQDASGVDTTYDKYDFEVFSDNRSVATHLKKGTYASSNKNEQISYTLINDDLIECKKALDDETATPDYTKKDVISSGEGSYSNVPQTIANNAVTYPILGSFNWNNARQGFAQYVLLNYFTGNYFGESSKGKESFVYSSSSEGVYDLKITNVGYSDKKELSLKLVFKDEMLVSFSGKITKYEIDWEDNVTLEGYTVIDAALETGTRDKSHDLFDADSLYMTDFNASFYTGYGTNKKVGTEFGIGDSVYFDIVDVLPTTADSSIDTCVLSIKEEDKDKVTMGSGGASFSAKQAIDDLEVTLTSAKTSKTFHLTFKEKLTTTLKYDGTNHMVLGESVTSKVTFDKKASTDINFTITSANAAKATIEPKVAATTSGYQQLTFTPSEVGTYSIKAVDKKSSLEVSWDVVVYNNDDAGIINYLKEANVKNYGTKLVKKSWTVSSDNVFTATFSYSYTDDYDDAVTDTIEVVFTFEGGQFKKTSTTNKSGNGVTVKSLAFDIGHTKLKVTMSDNVSYSLSIY